jgi:hypothetical protein
VNRYQKITLVIAAANLLLVLLFPPFDQYSIAKSKVPVFAGFSFAFSRLPYSELNTGVLALEVLVVLINAGIVWLLLRDIRAGAARRRLGYQHGVLFVTGFNLVMMLLFPPFESVYAATNAALPTFDGFHFILNRQPNHFVVTTLLYLEVIFIVVNGGLFWLIFRPRDPTELTPKQIFAMAAQMRGKGAR